MVEVHQNLRAKVAGGAGGISWRDRDSDTRTLGLPQESSGEMGSEGSSHQNLPSSCRSSAQGPEEGGESLITDWLLL